MTNATRSTRPTTALVGLEGEHPAALASRLGLEAGSLANVADIDARHQTVILVRPPAPQTFSSTTDHDLEAVEATFVAFVHALQRATIAVRENRESESHHSIAILIPSDAALGTRDAVLPSMLVGAVLSFTRTMAIELKKDAITANSVLYGNLDDDAEASTISTLLETFRTATTLTGQETYTFSGPNLGRIKP